MIIITKSNEKQRLKPKKQIQRGVRVGSFLQKQQKQLKSKQKKRDKKETDYLRNVR